MNKVLIKRFLFLIVLATIAIVFTTCTKNGDNGYEHPFESIPTLTYNNTIGGYIYLNCSQTPATNYPITLYHYGSASTSTYYTDSKGHYSIPYTYTTYEGMWTPQNPDWLYLSENGINISLPFDVFGIYNSAYDTNVAINNINIVLNDSAHFRAVFKFSQAFSNLDTLYYQFYEGVNSVQSIVGPFPSRLVFNCTVPLQLIEFSLQKNGIQFNYGIGINNFNYGNDRQFFNYKSCSLDSLVISYY